MNINIEEILKKHNWFNYADKSLIPAIKEIVEAVIDKCKDSIDLIEEKETMDLDETACPMKGAIYDWIQEDDIKTAILNVKTMINYE